MVSIFRRDCNTSSFKVDHAIASLTEALVSPKFNQTYPILQLKWAREYMDSFCRWHNYTTKDLIHILSSQKLKKLPNNHRRWFFDYQFWGNVSDFICNKYHKPITNGLERDLQIDTGGKFVDSVNKKYAYFTICLFKISIWLPNTTKVTLGGLQKKKQ